MQPANAKHAMFVAWALCGLTLATAAVAVALGVTVDGVESAVPEAGAQGPVDSDATGLLTFGMVAAFAVVGAVVAARRPRNPVGWFLGAIPALLALAMLAEGIYWHAAVAGDGDAGAAEFGLWFADTWWIPTLLLVFVFLPLLFPSGRPPTPRWNLVAWVAAAGGSILFVGTAFQPGRLATYAWVENPLAVQGMPAAVSGIGFAAAIAATLGALASLVVRFRRSRGVERQQLKWFLAAAVQLVVLWVASAALEPLVSDNASWAILLTGLLGVAIAVALAILRHRLYDIDLVVNRALVYGALTAILAGTYLGSVLLLQLVLSGLTGDSDVAVAASTLAVAALFRPVRARIQALVDRRFYRRRYDAQRTLEAFAALLRDEVALDALSTDLRRVVAESMQPAHVSLWLRPRDAASP
jgi:hypothetical protein